MYAVMCEGTTIIKHMKLNSGKLYADGEIYQVP